MIEDRWRCRQPKEFNGHKVEEMWVVFDEMKVSDAYVAHSDMSDYYLFALGVSSGQSQGQRGLLDLKKSVEWFVFPVCISHLWDEFVVVFL